MSAPSKDPPRQIQQKKVIEREIRPETKRTSALWLCTISSRLGPSSRTLETSISRRKEKKKNEKATRFPSSARGGLDYLLSWRVLNSIIPYE
jgi:hypothetical protein